MAELLPGVAPFELNQRPPAELSPAGRALWVSVARRTRLRPDQWFILEMATSVLDLTARLRATAVDHPVLADELVEHERLLAELVEQAGGRRLRLVHDDEDDTP